MYRVSGQHPSYLIHEEPNVREATQEEADAIHAQELAELYVERDVLCCDSMLVDELISREDMEGFSLDDAENLLPNPSEWDLAACREWLDDAGVDYNKPPLELLPDLEDVAAHVETFMADTEENEVCLSFNDEDGEWEVVDGMCGSCA
jgi:hypothetical protein